MKPNPLLLRTEGEHAADFGILMARRRTTRYVSFTSGHQLWQDIGNVEA